MQFLTGSVARIYGISTILAFLTGLMEAVSWVAAAMFAGTNSLFAWIVWLILGAWAICNLIAIISLGSQKSFPLGFAIAGSSAVSVVCGYALILLRSGQQVNDPLYFTAPISAWAWETIPFVFNAIQVVLSILRYQQLSALR
jgi:hypothetical protein